MVLLYMCNRGYTQHSLGKKGKLIDRFESLNTFFFVYLFLFNSPVKSSRHSQVYPPSLLRHLPLFLQGPE